MEDIFYFAKARVSLENIAQLAQDIGYELEYQTRTSATYLRVYFGGFFERYSRAAPDSPDIDVTLAKDFWEWSTWDDFHCLEPQCREQLSVYEPASSFMISYHPVTLPHLAHFMKRVLKVYGGWVACDDSWQRTYDLTDVENMDCNGN